MRPIPFLIAAIACSLPVGAGESPPRAGGAPLPLDDFEAGAWRFVGGEEFPGAKGALTRDAVRPHGGAGSCRLDADFRGGGAYVGCWRDLRAADLPDVEGFRIWARARGLSRIGVRLIDDTGQCHQGSVTLPGGAEGGWREVALDVRALVGGEHWGGANDGQWHGPSRGLGFNIGKDAVGPSQQGTLWIDDLVALPVAPGLPTLRSCSMAPSRCRPGFGTRVAYEWDAEPLGRDCGVFVHFVDASGRMAFQVDHAPPVVTSRWSGRVAYARTAVAPADLPPGRYDVVVGLWDGPRGRRLPFRVGPGLAALPGDACRVGSLEVAPDAPPPVLAPPSLDLRGYRLTFDEDFRGPLSVSAWGPGTRWIAHTPYGGDFGDAAFADPGADSPFSVREGVLRIEARKIGGRWRSGLLCSVDPKGAGFSQRYGYFEMRAKFPGGPGTWPAFWLMGVPQLVEPRDKKTLTQVEIDVVEQYGVGPNALHTTVHLWGPDKFHWAEGDTHLVAGMTEGFHTYGALVEEDAIRFYYDGVELRRSPTPKEARVPLYLMVDLALGGGWPIERTPDPSTMLVDYVRAYAKD